MFEGSYLGDNSKLDAAAKLECGICWWVYDPDEGDAQAHVVPGTPFAALPAQWHCPNCEAPKHKFMVLA
jgi:rubredoxin